MKPSHNTAMMQQEINEVQALYREWLSLAPRLEAAQQEWHQAVDIMNRLSGFYFDGRYREYADAIGEGAAVDLRTPGEYSVMSEDALWDAFHDMQRMAWSRLRSAVAVLDRKGEEGD